VLEAEESNAKKTFQANVSKKKPLSRANDGSSGTTLSESLGEAKKRRFFFGKKKSKNAMNKRLKLLIGMGGEKKQMPQRVQWVGEKKKVNLPRKGGAILKNKTREIQRNGEPGTLKNRGGEGRLTQAKQIPFLGRKKTFAKPRKGPAGKVVARRVVGS